jgi:hypothetical protein
LFDRPAWFQEYATLLRAHLLNGLDPAVPPKSVRSVDYSRAGTDVRASASNGFNGSGFNRPHGIKMLPPNWLILKPQFDSLDILWMVAKSYNYDQKDG